MRNQKKKSIALVVDVKGWAFYNIATQIIKNLSGDFNFTIYYCGDRNLLYSKEHPCLKTINLHKVSLYEELFLDKKHDLVFFFSRRELNNIFNQDFIKLYPQIDKFPKLLTNFLSTTVTTGVYDHMFLFPKEIKDKKNIFNTLSDDYLVSSQKLFNIYNNLPGYKKPLAIIQDGVNLNLFYPKNVNRFQNKDRKIIIGWVGNSKWTGAGLIKEKNYDNKGFYSIVQPSLKILEKKGFNFGVNIADRNVTFRPLEKMVNFYEKIDVLICSSKTEGTPNPVLEAMACGVPVLSTDVGIVSEVFGPEQKKFIYKRNPNVLAKKLSQIIKNPEILQKLSQENLKRVKNFTRQKESLKWKKFFNQALENKQKQTKWELIDRFSRIIDILMPLSNK